MIAIIIILFGLNIIALGCMSDIRKLTPNMTVLDFCLATKIRRIVMLIAPIAFIVGTFALVYFILYSVFRAANNFINDK